MYPRTRRQKEILNFIDEFIQARGHQPSYQEIADNFKLASKGAVARHIEALENQGLLSRRLEDGAFSLAVSPAASSANQICEVNWIDLSEFPGVEVAIHATPVQISIQTLGVFNPDKVCAFKVENDSMLADHICEGDIAILEKRSLARDSDIVLAVVDESRVVLKRIFKSTGHVELRPSNSKYETLNLPSDRVAVRGVFRGLIRPLA